jgi:hypothetical protein
MLMKLDFYFPFCVFFYGLVMTFVLEIPFLIKLSQNEMPRFHQQFEKHRAISTLAIFVGGLWSIQNLWFS